MVSNQVQHANLMLGLWLSLESEYDRRIQGPGYFELFLWDDFWLAGQAVALPEH